MNGPALLRDEVSVDLALGTIEKLLPKMRIFMASWFPNEGFVAAFGRRTGKSESRLSVVCHNHDRFWKVEFQQGEPETEAGFSPGVWVLFSSDLSPELTGFLSHFLGEVKRRTVNERSYFVGGGSQPEVLNKEFWDGVLERALS